ncbi:MAG: hypothetical protein GWN93_02895 [Deltaproteobacteria bacterium]|nr:hypothetical protein [Deltaproteobacteria bacterium]
MILAFGLMVIIVGILMCNMNLFMPLTIGTYMLLQMLQLMGLGLCFIGVMIIGARSYQTGAGMWMDIPAKDTVINIHSGISGKRLDPNAKFFKCKDIGLGILKAKKKVFKDTGGGFRIHGHDVRRTHEKIGADISEWLGEYLHQCRKRFKLRNDKEMKELYEQLRRLHEPIPGMSIMDQLENIKILEPALKDERCRNEISKMNIDELRNMTMYLFDGETVHMEDVENFIKLASPNELDTWIQQEISLNELEKKTYREPGPAIDWNKWLPALGMFMIIGILAAVILMSYLK